MRGFGLCGAAGIALLIGLGAPAAQALPVTFAYSGAEVTWTVPTTGLYDIVAFGAQGGGFNSVLPGGLGAEIGGDVALTAGTTLTILVGGKGGTGAEPGGGGGSFVVDGVTPIIIAGGGGGGSFRNTPVGVGLTGTGGGSTNGTGTPNGGVGGQNGGGGAAGLGTDGGGGGGFSGDGTANFSTTHGGKSFLNGGAGGVDSNPNFGPGGFGGGGTGGAGFVSGGGGGYSGGGAGRGGGGGGSYIDLAPGGIYGDAYLATNAVLVAGENAGDGSVTITFLSATAAAVPEPASLAALASGLAALALLRRRQG